MNIALIGYRGCGKTTVGRLLAERLGLSFVDTDALVCEKFGGAAIKEIWERHGEAAFREMECRVTREVFGDDRRVIAFGGGTPMQPEARAAMEAAGNLFIVYLKCEPAELLRRIRGDRQTAATRPNLTSLGGGLEEVTKTLAEREPVYEAVADLVLDVTHTTDPMRTVERVAAEFTFKPDLRRASGPA